MGELFDSIRSFVERKAAKTQSNIESTNHRFPFALVYVLDKTLYGFSFRYFVQMHVSKEAELLISISPEVGGVCTSEVATTICVDILSKNGVQNPDSYKPFYIIYPTELLHECRIMTLRVCFQDKRIQPFTSPRNIAEQMASTALISKEDLPLEFQKIAIEYTPLFPLFCKNLNPEKRFATSLANMKVVLSEISPNLFFLPLKEMNQASFKRIKARIYDRTLAVERMFPALTPTFDLIQVSPDVNVTTILSQIEVGIEAYISSSQYGKKCALFVSAKDLAAILVRFIEKVDHSTSIEKIMLFHALTMLINETSKSWRLFSSQSDETCYELVGKILNLNTVDNKQENSA